MATIIRCNNPEKLISIGEKCSFPSTALTRYFLEEGMIKSVCVKKATLSQSDARQTELMVHIGNDKYIVPFIVARNLIGVLRPITENISFTFVGELRPHQVPAVEECVEMLNTLGACNLLADPGFGKTTIYIKLISVLKQKTLIVLPTIPLAKQTYNAILEFGGVDPERIFIPDTDGEIPDHIDIAIVYVGRISKHPKSYERFTFVVFDEVHMLTSPTYLCGLMSLRPLRVASFTATPGKRTKITEMFVGDSIVHGKIIRPWSICFPCIETGVDMVKIEEESRNEDGSDGSPMVQYTNAITAFTEDDKFITSIVRIARHFVKLKKRMIIITMRVEMTQLLYDTLEADSQKVNGLYGSYIVEYLDREKRECDNCNVLLGTHKMIGTGFDEKNAIKDFQGSPSSVLLFIGSIKDETLMYQLSGRVFRGENPLVIFPHFTDIRFSGNHINAVKAILEEKFPDCNVVDDIGYYLSNVMKGTLVVRDLERKKLTRTIMKCENDDD